jgi:hypothetical protein
MMMKSHCRRQTAKSDLETIEIAQKRSNALRNERARYHQPPTKQVQRHSEKVRQKIGAAAHAQELQVNDQRG